MTAKPLTCPDCRIVLAPWQPAIHTCFELRWIAAELASFEAKLADYLASARGRFELFYAERTRAR